jgi:hypothetical protein
VLYGLVVSLGISPEYFLDEISFDEINALIDRDNKKVQNEWEKARIGWYYSLISAGLSKAQKPEDLMKFSWEDIKKEAKVLSKEEVENKTKQAEQWLNNRLM